MLQINWEDRGRTAWRQASPGLRATLNGYSEAEQRQWLRGKFSDTLAAARWGGNRAARCNALVGNRSLSPGFCADEAEAEAIRLLVAGFQAERTPTSTERIGQ